MDAKEAGEAKRDMSGHFDKVVFTEDCFLITLAKLRTVLSFRLLRAWFGVNYNHCVRIFSTWIPYLYHFFDNEFPNHENFGWDNTAPMVAGLRWGTQVCSGCH